METPIYLWNRKKISAKYEFGNGRARMLNRGVNLWNGREDEIGPDNPQRSLDNLVFELIGAEEVWSDAYHLKGIKVAIEIEEVTRQ